MCGKSPSRFTKPVRAHPPVGEEVWRGKEQGPAAHDEHAGGDVGGLGGAGPAAEVRHRDDGEQRAEVVGAGDDAALSGVQSEAALEGRDDDVGEDHALHDGRQAEASQQPPRVQPQPRPPVQLQRKLVMLASIKCVV